MEKFSSLFQAGSIGSLRLRNRLVMGGMGNILADGQGHVTQTMIDYYGARARGGVGLIVTRFASVSLDATLPHMLAIYHDGFIAGLSRLADVIHQGGAKVSVQLMHCGMVLAFMGQTPEGMTVKVPTVVPRMPAGKAYQEITEHDIDLYVEDFSEAARRAKEAGADAVELHACHGCLISTFLSPATNRRQGPYGGSVGNRTRFAARILERIKEKTGADFPVWIRINGSDDISGGTTIHEAAQQAAILEAAGADAISISAGFGYWSPLNIPCYAFHEGPMIPLAERVKQSVRVPVMVAGKIGPELAERTVREDKADYIVVCRPLLADPELPNKLLGNRLQDIRPCVHCNNCVSALSGSGSSCTVNPFLYDEVMSPPSPTDWPRNVAVVGGGLAGMQAAALLAQRGHRVCLYERTARLGGQWNIASAMPEKKAYAEFTKCLTRDLERHGVSIRLNVEVTKEMILKTTPDVVVVATGAIPRDLYVPRSGLCNVVQANSVINGDIEAEGRVVVIGGRLVGMEVAAWLAEQAKQVTLVTRAGLGDDGTPVERSSYRVLARRLIDLRVPIYVDVSVLEITEDGVVIGWANDIFTVQSDTVILAIGAQPDSRLAHELEGVIAPARVHIIGDCLEPRDAAAATYAAARLALSI